MKFTKLSLPVLLMVDFQRGFRRADYWGGRRNNPDAERSAAHLLRYWREDHLPVIHVQHCSTFLTSPLHETNEGNMFEEIVAPLDGEPVFKKKAHSAFIGTELQQYLDQGRMSTLIIAGLTTDHCVSTTARMGSDLGYKIYVVSDATATFGKRGSDGLFYSAEFIHDTALASLKDEFASIVTSEWIRESMGLGVSVNNFKS